MPTSSQLVGRPPLNNPTQAAPIDPRLRVSLVTLCIIAAVIAGIVFRFYHIDRKVYWEDETYTSLHALGLTEAAIVQRAPRLIDAGALRAILHPAQPVNTTAGDTIRSLATEDPQHPPLYYVAAHMWVQHFGDSIGVIRALSAAIGILALPCMYWLCWELFASVLAARLGVALFAIAPIAVLFSQEAREYISWSLAVIVMSAAFLRASRRKSVGAWAVYAITIATGLYVFPISGLFVAANLCTAAVMSRRNVRALAAPIAASLLGGIAFFPWIIVLYRGLHKVDRAMGLSAAARGSKLAVLHHFVALFKLDFVDLNVTAQTITGLATSLVVLTLLAFASGHLMRSAPRRATLFIFMTMLWATAPFVILDIVLGQHFTDNPRYFMPLYLGLDLMLAGAFASLLHPANVRSKFRFALLLLAMVIGVRAASCAASSQADTWWNKFGERSIEIAKTINQSDRPLIVSTEFMERSLSLSNYLRTDVALQLRPRCYLCSDDNAQPFVLGRLEEPRTYSDVFILGSPATLRADVTAAVVRAPGGTRSHCIDDSFDDLNGCADADLHLWPR